MYLKSLRLENFRSHVATTLALAPLTVIRGTNAAGKSSIEQALQIALASRAEGTAADGKGSAGLIRAGQTKALLTLDMIGGDDDQPDSRQLKCALNDGRRACVVADPTNPQWGGASDFLDFLAVHKEVLSCLINNRFFVDLAPDAQRDILAAIILPKLYTWPDWVVPAANSAGLTINWGKTPFEIAAQAHELAFKERTNVNRDLKNFRMPEGDTSAAADFDQITAALTERTQQLETAVATLARQQAADNARVITRETATRRLAEATARLSREEQSVAGIEERLLSPAKLKEAEKTAKNKPTALLLDKDVADLDAKIVAQKNALAQLNTLSTQPTCPTCSQVITAEVVAALAQPAIAERSRLEELRRTAIENRRKLGNPEEAETLLSAHKQATIDLETAKRRANDERTIVQDAQAKLDEIGSAIGQEDYSAQESEIADLRARVQRGNEALAKARAAVILAQQIDKAKVQQTALQERQQTLERLVTYFGDSPEGVKAELLKESVGPFVETINRVLASWSFQCVIDPATLQFHVVFVNGLLGMHSIPLKHLSKSQRYRFATAFQVALAAFSGLRFVVLDEADIYDGDARAGLFEALQAHLESGDLEQAIVLSTDERENVPPAPNAVFYRFDDIAEPGQIPTTQVRQLGVAQHEKAA